MIERIGVVGCGLMGSGIAEVSARAGLDVIVHDVDEERVAAGRHRIESSLGRAVRSAKLDPEARDRAQDRLRFTTDLGSFADRDLVVEAVSGLASAKCRHFRASR